MTPILVTIELALAQPILNIIKNSIMSLSHDQWKSQIEPIINTFEMSIGNAIKAYSASFKQEEPVSSEN